MYVLHYILLINYLISNNNIIHWYRIVLVLVCSFEVHGSTIAVWVDL